MQEKLLFESSAKKNIMMTKMNVKTLSIITLGLAIAVITFVLLDARLQPQEVPPDGDEPGSAVPSAMRQVKVYFSNSTLDPEVSCDKVFSVEREIEDTPAVARAALTELLKGPSSADEKEGYFTNINQGVAIRSISIQDDVAKIDLDAKLEEGVGGSCRVMAIRSQIEQTLLQFPTVKSVVISIEGRVGDVLQP